MQTKEICEDCGKLFVAGPDAYLCPECRKKRLSEYAKRRKAERIRRGSQMGEEKGGDERWQGRLTARWRSDS